MVGCSAWLTWNKRRGEVRQGLRLTSGVLGKEILVLGGVKYNYSSTVFFQLLTHLPTPQWDVGVTQKVHELEIELSNDCCGWNCLGPWALRTGVAAADTLPPTSITSLKLKDKLFCALLDQGPKSSLVSVSHHVLLVTLTGNGNAFKMKGSLRRSAWLALTRNNGKFLMSCLLTKENN